MSVSVAVIGSGPAGMYAVDGLLKSESGHDFEIDVIDRLPSPFGLIRAGVAPDHFKTRNTARQFMRTLDEEAVRYLGNVEVGRDLSYEELKANYDVVIFAIGAYNDRALGVPGEGLPGVYGACAFVGWYNGHPDYRDLDPLLDKGGVAVIGIGNVALDVSRLLAKTPSERDGSDICEHAEAAIAAAPLDTVYVFGRRGPNEAGFTPKELGEIRDLKRCAVKIDPAQLPDSVPDNIDGRVKGIKEKNLGILQDIAGQDKDLPVTMNMTFYASPIEVLGTDRVEGLRLERTNVVDGKATATGETFDIEVGAVVTAIGYHAVAPEGVPMDGGVIANDKGRVEDGVYCVGWCKRGPTGTIPTNGPDSREVVDLILEDISDGEKPGRDAIDALLAERGPRIVSWPEWQKIADEETARAAANRPRERFTRISEMLAVLD
ncbi:MAG: FAD-dependent oxidoreductase [Proteobacteria bacterium]|nr:FAD-dependent oxidoreductase [Pseudomonadota bacterium]